MDDALTLNRLLEHATRFAADVPIVTRTSSG